MAFPVNVIAIGAGLEIAAKALDLIRDMRQRRAAPLERQLDELKLDVEKLERALGAAATQLISERRRFNRDRVLAIVIGALGGLIVGIAVAPMLSGFIGMPLRF